MSGYGLPSYARAYADDGGSPRTRCGRWFDGPPAAPQKPATTARRVHRYHIPARYMPEPGQMRLFGAPPHSEERVEPGSVTVHFDALGLGVVRGAYMLIDRSNAAGETWLRIAYYLDRASDKTMTFNFQLLPAPGEPDVYLLDDLDVFTKVTRRRVYTSLRFDGADAALDVLVERLPLPRPVPPLA